MRAVVAALLSPLAREAIDGPCPAFVFEADGPGAGKTLAASVCGALVMGRVPAPRQYTADDDETEKRLGAVAIAGHPFIIIDNVRAHVEGGAMERVLTAHESIAFRRLGRSEDVELPWRAIMALTMNSASFSADVSDRVVQITMQSRSVDLDATASFTINDLVRHTIDNRPRLLRAAFTILRAHQLAGRPMPGATLPRFEAWSRVVAAAVHWAGGHDPVRARPPESANRDANVARAVALAWCAAFPNGEAHRVGHVLQLVRAIDPSRPGAEGPARAAALGALRDALADLAGASDPGRVSPGSLGRRLEKVRDRWFVDPGNAGRRVMLVPGPLEHGSKRYAGRVEVIGAAPATETPEFPPDHPAALSPEGGEWGSEGESHNRQREGTPSQNGAVTTWEA